MRGSIIVAGLALLTIAGLALFGALLFLGYDVPWTGFGEQLVRKLPNEEVLPAKTLWDWLNLLIIPVVLSMGALALNQAEKRREQRLAQERAAVDRELAAEASREAALQSYFDRLTELLRTGAVHPDAIVNTEVPLYALVARARTLSVLPALDPTRRSRVLRFLAELQLIQKDKVVISLVDADLSGVTASGWHLPQIDLSFAHLEDADFAGAYLEGAKFTGSILSRARFTNANLYCAELTGVNLEDAILDGARCQGAVLDAAKAQRVSAVAADFGPHETRTDENTLVKRQTALAGVDFTGATLEKASFKGAYLINAVFAGSILHGADFTGAVTRGASFAGAVDAPTRGGAGRHRPQTDAPVDQHTRSSGE